MIGWAHQNRQLDGISGQAAACFLRAGERFLVVCAWYSLSTCSFESGEIRFLLRNSPADFQCFQSQGCRQQDSHELLRCLLDGLQTEETKLHKQAAAKRQLADGKHKVRQGVWRSNCHCPENAVLVVVVTVPFFASVTVQPLFQLPLSFSFKLLSKQSHLHANLKGCFPPPVDRGQCALRMTGINKEWQGNGRTFHDNDTLQKASAQAGGVTV